MADEIKPESIVSKTITTTRQTSWRFFGALFMEEKNGVQAVSLHKVLGLTTYVACMALWLKEKEIAESMLYTLWGSLAINGASKVTSILKGNGNEPSA